MKRDVGAFEAKTHFSELLLAVAHGEEFTITKHGQKIAKLIPFPKEEMGHDSDLRSAIRAIKKLRSGTKLGKSLSIKKMRQEGRK